jgi:hypothetical protein
MMKKLKGKLLLICIFILTVLNSMGQSADIELQTDTIVKGYANISLNKWVDAPFNKEFDINMKVRLDTLSNLYAYIYDSNDKIIIRKNMGIQKRGKYQIEVKILFSESGQYSSGISIWSIYF